MAHTDYSDDKLLQPQSEIASRGAVLISGTPYCGKSKLMQILQIAAKYLVGFEFFDSSAIMDWHKNLANNSPFLAEFTGQVTEARISGDLVDDLPVCRGIGYRLQARLEERKASMNKYEFSIRGLGLFGAPRTRYQYDILKKMLPGSALIGISQTENRANAMRLKKNRGGRSDDQEAPFRNRWVKYRAKTEPFIKECQGAGDILMMDFADTLTSKCIRTVNVMPGLSPVEQKSLHRQMLNDACEAFWLIQEIDHPKQYEDFLRSIKVKPTLDWHNKWLQKMEGVTTSEQTQPVVHA